MTGSRPDRGHRRAVSRSRALAASLFLIAIPLLAAISTPARADYRFCNATSYILSGAIGFQDDPKDPHSEWHSQGWARMNPGDCATVLKGPVRGGGYYIFARSADLHQGPIKYFSGNERFCTLPGDFATTGRENCAVRGYESNDFIRVETKSGDEWTTTFGEPRDYSLSAARIAGAQRLLRDNGFRTIKIDGYAAKATLRSIQAFQRASGRTPTGEIDDDLISELSDGARKGLDERGLDICNQTHHLAWAAIGFADADQEKSSGWIRIEPGACAKAIKDKLSEPRYYLYAEGVDDKGMIATENGHRLVWSGQDIFCTKTTRFEIRGRDSCQKRGYDQKPFMRVDTGGKTRIEVPLR